MASAKAAQAAPRRRAPKGLVPSDGDAGVAAEANARRFWPWAGQPAELEEFKDGSAEEVEEVCGGEGGRRGR